MELELPPHNVKPFVAVVTALIRIVLARAAEYCGTIFNTMKPPVAFKPNAVDTPRVEFAKLRNCAPEICVNAFNTRFAVT